MQYSRRLQLNILYLLLFLSGFAGLGYEIVWTRMLSAGLGHEIVAALSVIAAFFSGLALGAWILDSAVSRSRYPGRWYAGLEVLIGLWSLVLSGLFPLATEWAFRMLGPDPTPIRHWSTAFFFPFFLLLPATAAMGGTLPAMERLFSRLRQNGRSVGGVYAANTLGAVLGILLATLLIVPAYGFTRTQQILAAINLFCAAGVLAGASRGEAKRPSVNVEIPDIPEPSRLYATLFFTGLLGIGFEVLTIRVLSQILENTVYSFACILSVYLLGTALGGAMYQIRPVKGPFSKILGYLLTVLSATCLAAAFLLNSAASLYQALQDALAGGLRGALAAEFLLAAILFAPPTVVMGYTFSHLAQGARKNGGGLGRGLCLNTLGASLAPFLFGIFLLPELGAKTSLLTASAGYLLLIPPSRRVDWKPVLIPAAMAILLFAGPWSLQFVDPPPQGRILAHREGIMATVTVEEDARSQRRLKVNNRYQMGGTGSVYSDHRQAHIPLLLHPAPRKALFLGLGTGATFAAAADHPDLKATAVELVPEIPSVLHFFEKANGDIGSHPRLSIRIADARRFVSTDPGSYDVIVADLFHPARDGAGYLYTVEHYQAVQRRLSPGGLFCQWLPVYQLDREMLRVIIRTFLKVFPDGSAFLAHYSLETPILGLIGTGNGPLTISPGVLNHRVRDASLARRLAGFRLTSAFTLLGGYLADANDLARFAEDVPLNTDDRPVVLFEAPRFLYNRTPDPAYRLLMEMIDTFSPSAADLLQPSPAPGNGDALLSAKTRLEAYWTARNRFLRAGIGVPKTRDLRNLLRHVREPLLAVIEESPDFDGAYAPLLEMARQLSAIDPEGGRKLLLDMVQARPDRPEARHLLDALHQGGSGPGRKPLQGASSDKR